MDVQFAVIKLQRVLYTKLNTSMSLYMWDWFHEGHNFTVYLCIVLSPKRVHEFGTFKSSPCHYNHQYLCPYNFHDAILGKPAFSGPGPLEQERWSHTGPQKLQEARYRLQTLYTAPTDIVVLIKLK